MMTVQHPRHHLRPRQTVQQPRHHLRPRQLRPSPSPPQQPLRRSPRGLRRLQSSRQIRRQQQKHHLRPRQLQVAPPPPHQPLRRSTVRWPCRSKLQQAAGSVFLPHSPTRRRGECLQINDTRVSLVRTRVLEYLQSIVVAAQARAAEAAGACAVLQKMAKNLGKTRPVSLIQESQNDPKVKNNMGFSLLNG